MFARALSQHCGHVRGEMFFWVKLTCTFPCSVDSRNRCVAFYAHTEESLRNASGPLSGCECGDVSCFAASETDSMALLKTIPCMKEQYASSVLSFY